MEIKNYIKFSRRSFSRHLQKNPQHPNPHTNVQVRWNIPPEEINLRHQRLINNKPWKAILKNNL